MSEILGGGGGGGAQSKNNLENQYAKHYKRPGGNAR